MAEYVLIYHSNPVEIDRMLDQLEEILARHEVADTLGRQVCLTVSEAFTNALIHGNKADPDKEIKLGLTVNETEITADIVDQGTSGVTRVANKQPATPLAECGRGVDLMRHFAQSVVFQQHEDGGLRVIITFSRKDNQFSNHT